ncbi:hypothetical protein BOX15_Mlig002122g2, partial [Macrostomum lignano]
GEANLTAAASQSKQASHIKQSNLHRQDALDYSGAESVTGATNWQQSLLAKARDAWYAALGISNEATADRWNERRLNLVARYANAVTDLPEEDQPQQQQQQHQRYPLSRQLSQQRGSRRAGSRSRGNALSSAYNGGRSLLVRLASSSRSMRSRQKQRHGSGPAASTAADAIQLQTITNAEPSASRQTDATSPDRLSPVGWVQRMPTVRIATPPSTPIESANNMASSVYMSVETEQERPEASLAAAGDQESTTNTTTAQVVDPPLTAQYRAYFTWWISTVQCLIMLVLLFSTELAHPGLSVQATRSASLPNRYTLMSTVCAIDYQNLFIGPRLPDLIRCGAKYAPCMRWMPELYNRVLGPQLVAENSSGCCVLNDGSACFQSTKRLCPAGSATWLRWTADSPGPGNRTSGPVCGQDPRTCLDPPSLEPSQWPDDITLWPPCRRSLPASSLTSTSTISTSSSIDAEVKHLTCPVSAAPCCVGIKGECVLTTTERCKFLRGRFHPEVRLCSQVNCLDESCGLFGGISTDSKPNQWYRIFTSLFIHSGLLSLLLSLFVQLRLLVQVEHLAGWHRTAAIYLGSGLYGNLVSLNLLPNLVDARPAPAQLGALCPLGLELLMSAKQLSSPRFGPFIALTFCVIAVLLASLLPWFDLAANAGGLISGCLLTPVLLPHVKLGKRLCSRAAVLCLCALVWLVTIVGLALVFFVYDGSELPLRCNWCALASCAPRLLAGGNGGADAAVDRFADLCGDADLRSMQPTQCIGRLAAGFEQ